MIFFHYFLYIYTLGGKAYNSHKQIFDNDHRTYVKLFFGKSTSYAYYVDLTPPLYIHTYATARL